MMRKIDGKFSIRVSDPDVAVEIVNPAGIPIPEDEPLFLLRARDRLALAAIQYYYTLSLADSATDYHIDGVSRAAEAFSRFASEHPERMKQPGITRGQ